MTDPSTTTEERAAGEAADPTPPPDHEGAAMVESELLVEEISIDGMCGVY